MSFHSLFPDFTLKEPCSQGGTPCSFLQNHSTKDDRPSRLIFYLLFATRLENPTGPITRRILSIIFPSAPANAPWFPAPISRRTPPPARSSRHRSNRQNRD